MMISKLKAALESAGAKSHKYKMRWLRLKHVSDKRTNHCEQYDDSTPKVSHLNANTSGKSTPRSKTRYQMRHVTIVKKCLLFHNVMAEQTGNARKSHVSHKVPYSIPQQILKKYILYYLLDIVAAPGSGLWESWWLTSGFVIVVFYVNNFLINNVTVQTCKLCT